MPLGGQKHQERQRTLACQILKLCLELLDGRYCVRYPGEETSALVPIGYGMLDCQCLVWSCITSV